MKHPFLILLLAFMLLMSAFVIEINELTVQDDYRIVHQVVRDGTWVDTVKPYKLPEKNHFWTLP